jgi:penicillin-binding protein 1C
MPPDAASQLGPCTMHVQVPIDTRNGLRAGPTCPAAFVSMRTFERYDESMAAWATTAQRPTAPPMFSPLCPGRPGTSAVASTRIGWPRDGSRFVLDPERGSESQMLLVRVEAPANAQQVELRVDGRSAGRVRAPFVVPWPLSRGEHVMFARSDVAGASAPVTVVVE